MSEQTTSTDLGESAALQENYGKAYYSNYGGGAGPYERNERWLQFFGEVADGVVRNFHPATVLDAGCAIGMLVEQLVQRGVDAKGFDFSEYAISQVDESIAERCWVGSLTEPIEGRYDLITCVEVLEHLPPEEADRAIANLCAASDTLLISTTPEDYREPTHLNVMQPEAWAAKFAQHGFLRDLDRDASYLTPWAAVYVRRDEPLSETVRRYDRSLWQLRREATEVRASLLEVRAELATLQEQGSPAAEMQAELDRRNAEILRLRDLLIGMEIELGAAHGYKAQIEDRAVRLEGARRRLETKIPVLGPLLIKAYRLLRRLG